MQSHRSEQSHRRQYGDRSPRLKDDYDHRWEERHETPRDPPQDSYQKYGGNGCSSKERTSRRPYSDSPKILYSEDTSNRDLSRNSSTRRRMSSPDWGTFEKKRQRNTEDGNRYKLESEDHTTRRSPNSFSRPHVTKDFKQMLTQEEDFQYRKTPQDSRHKYVHDEFTYRQQQDNCRQSSGYYKDRVGHERSRDCSQERKSRGRSKKSYVKPRVRNDSPSPDHEEYRQNIGRFPMNASSGQPFEREINNQSPDVPEQKSTAGFQRFLNVLNKGVNVATLTKIVTQSSTVVSNRSSPPSFVNTDYPNYAEGQHGSHQNTSHWSDSEGFQRLASSQPRDRSFSPKGQFRSGEKSVQKGDGEPRNLSSNSRSRCPSGEQKMTLTPEEEHKHRQMQDVLQAIGMNLGSEELGQMSHRIQERLYGRKDRDCHRRESREMDTRRAFSPRPHSRSSSSSSSSSTSSCSPLKQKYYKKKDSYSFQSDVPEVHRNPVHEGVEYGQKSTSSTLQESDKFETWSEESAAAHQAFSQNVAYAFLKPSPTPAMPMYSPVDCSSASYPPFPPKLPPNLPPASYASLHMPPLPPFFPFSHAPPVSIFPAVLAQARHLLPQHVGNPPFFNLSGNNPNPPLNNTQKSKPLSRPRFLQVIETKQPG
ncbi:uncharacterized protein ACO6RY_19693 [Pungitius sinensis]